MTKALLNRVDEVENPEANEGVAISVLGSFRLNRRVFRLAADQEEACVPRVLYFIYARDLVK